MDWETGLYNCYVYADGTTYETYPYDTDVYEEDDCYYDVDVISWYCYDYTVGDYVYAWISLYAHENLSSNLYVSSDSYNAYELYYDGLGNKGLTPYGI